MAGVRPNNMEKHQGSVSLEKQRLCKGMHLESDHGGLIIKGIFYWPSVTSQVLYTVIQFISDSDSLQ